MNHPYFFLSILLTTCTLTSTQAQVRKSSLPVDTGVLYADQPIVLYDIPSKISRPETEKVFGGVEQPPEFPGGTKAMYKFIEANLRLPAEAQSAGVSGRVFTMFTIEITGEITNVSVIKGLGFGCDEEAVRLVQLMPRWKPGRKFSQIAKVRYALPISFTAR